MSTPLADERWLAFARDVIEHVVRNAPPPDTPLPDNPQPRGGVFVTLHKLGRLRGCIGNLDTSISLAEAIRDAAEGAALRDPRFSPVRSDELAQIRIRLSILTPLRPMKSLDEIVMGRTGIVVRTADARGLFLPEVAAHCRDREEFLSRCCSEKMHRSDQAWRDAETETMLFETEVFDEPER
ncbi:MAG: AmmeMemoRadiSam system protein A [Phycisphaerae bacterium]